jgi:hypothetical protein
MILRYLISTIVLFLLLSPLIISVITIAEINWLGYNSQYCEFDLVLSNYVVLICNFDILITDNGMALYIDVNQTSFNKVILERYYSLFAGGWRLSAQFTNDNQHPNGGSVEINLPLGYDYGSLNIIGWNLTIVWYYSNGTLEIRNHVLNLTSCPNMHCWSFRDNARPYIVQLKPILTQNIAEVPQPQPPAWNDISGWFNYLTYLAGRFAEWVGVALRILVTAVSYLLSIVPYLGFIVGLHIIGGFVQGIDKGVAVINFYISLGRRLFDLFIKVVQAILEIIDNILPT